MTTLLLDRAQLEVRTDGDALALYRSGERCGTVPMKLLERVVIQGSQIVLRSDVLTRLSEMGIVTLLLSPRMSRRVAIVLGQAHNDVAVRLAQAQRVMDAAFCARTARELVMAKLRRQRRFIKIVLAERADARKALFDAEASLARIGATLETQAEIETAILRGLEGSAARAYFQGLVAMFPPVLGFTSRNRRPPRDPVNACLSLAYTLLHFDAVRAAHIAGLDPLLGFYHRPAFGRESLACDLVEPLRPLADEWVWQRFRDRTLREDHFTRDKGACLLGKAGRGAFYAEWERFAKLPRRWLRTRAARLARLLRREGDAWLVEDEEETS
jgi:CRISPR-associated protein Cas1